MEHSKIDQENSSKLIEDNAEAQRIEIEQLKKDVAYHRSMLAELKEQNSHKTTTNLNHSSISENLNTSVDLQADLYRFAGMHCVKLDTAFVFQFLTGYKVTKNDIYAVEILKIDGQQRLGRWVMPMSIDLHDLVLEYPLENPKNIKPFLKCCKHHIDCYSSRREQYYRLKDFLTDTRNCSLDTTLGYLQVHLHISGIKMIDSEKIYNVSVYMGYYSDRAFPSRIAIELREGKLLPPEVAPYFSKYFKPFKRYNLQEAFERVINDTRVFQWEKVSYDSNDFALLSITDDEHDEGEHDEEESDELDETKKSEKLYKRKGRERSKKKNNDPIGSEVKNSEDKSLSSEEKEERSNSVLKANKIRAGENTNTEARKRKSKRILNSKASNVNIKKYLVKNKMKNAVEENSNAIGEKITMEELNENSKERENSKENSIGNENSKEKEDEQINRVDTINPSGDVKNDNVEISNNGSDKIGDEVEKNAPLNKTTPLSKSREQDETKLVTRSKKGRTVNKSTNKKSNVGNLSTKSVTNVNVPGNDKELTMIPTNVGRNNVICSTPISGKVEAKLYTSQCSEISKISLPASAKSKKNRTIVEQDTPDEEKSEEAVSSSISDDIGEENEYENAKELLKDIQIVLNKEEITKNTIQRTVKKTKKKKKKAKVT